MNTILAYGNLHCENSTRIGHEGGTDQGGGIMVCTSCPLNFQSRVLYILLATWARLRFSQFNAHLDANNFPTRANKDSLRFILRTFKILIPRDFNIHAVTFLTGIDQDVAALLTHTTDHI